VEKKENVIGGKGVFQNTVHPVGVFAFEMFTTPPDN